MILRFGTMASAIGMAAALAACVPAYPHYPASYAPLADLTGTTWVLESGTPIPTAAPADQPAPAQGTVQTAPAAAVQPAATPWLLPDRGSRPTLRFSADQGSVSGATGCNTYFGNAYASGNTLSFGALATTKMMCFDALAVQEIQYLDLLSKVRGYQNSGSQLVLSTSDGRQLVYTPLVNPVGARAQTYNYVCDDGLYFSAAYDPNAGTATLKLSTGATDTLTQEPAGSGTAYASPRHSLRGKGNEALLTTLYDGVQHRCKAPLAPEG